jgi:hypothetical protein
MPSVRRAAGMASPKAKGSSEPKRYFLTHYVQATAKVAILAPTPPAMRVRIGRLSK